MFVLILPFIFARTDQPPLSVTPRTTTLTSRYFVGRGNEAMKLYALDQHHDGLVDLIISFLVAGLATLAVALRCWARRIRGVDLWIDDWLALGALVILWALVGDQVAGMTQS